MNDDGMVDGMSVGIFTNDSINSLEYIAGSDSSDGMEFLSADNIFYVEFRKHL